MWPTRFPDAGWTVKWGVILDGQDLTTAWAPTLIDISVTDKAGEASDSCSLTIDDTDGKVRMPAKRMPLVVMLEGARVFRGFVEKVESSGSRGAGRLLKVQAKGFDTGGKAKEPQAFHLDDTDLDGYLTRLAQGAGIGITVDPDLGALQQDYWSADGESFIAIGERLARKFGGTFKIRGDQAIFAKRGGGLSPGGLALGVTEAVFGENLIDWSITPKDPRRKFSAGKARWFDRPSASFKESDLDFGNADLDALHLVRTLSADESEADAVLDARKRDGEREGGSGSVKLDLAVGAVVEGQCRIAGARPGIDGTYLIETVKHSASRSGGATTALDLKQPGGGAGKDSRKAGEPAFALPSHETLG
ncbi:phage late control D family protein [Devosia ginsengisoli]|uniref:phage late control D family protein n=1 Tax=Devosia ginsengisoli TaxID=400770 RepID=UPI0026EAFB91|nr:late control D family protein [Devosia ginsengisoli]MCR6672214.1 late control D family protein [Devosia ginsengisoli]